MFLSVFEIFKIGVGPSSSHTMGPMTAARRFLSALKTLPVAQVQVSLHGSLAFTGKGHASDRAVCLGLLGHEPATLDQDQAACDLKTLADRCVLAVEGVGEVIFNPQSDLIFDYEQILPSHANGMCFYAYDLSGTLLERQVFYSIGGGFVVSEAELLAASPEAGELCAHCAYPFKNAAQMLKMAHESGMSIAEMKRANECLHRSTQQIDHGLTELWSVMNGCIERGLQGEGVLPGGLKVRRRAKALHGQLLRDVAHGTVQPHAASDWLSLYAMAVNEENADGGRVVTAPTNGAAGVVPAVLRYYLDHCVGSRPDKIPEFLLTAAAIGGLIKHNASISGAEAGCQGEVGSAAAMAAAGLCAVLGGTPAQIENAAEIALEHHLGMTCDPVGGLVQVPCIERNGMGAIKAVAAASLALRGDGSHFMPLDNCIEAMRQTGEAMNERFKETSLGGLAINLPEC